MKKIDIKEIESLIKLAKNEGVTKLKIENGESKISISFEDKFVLKSGLNHNIDQSSLFSKENLIQNQIENKNDSSNNKLSENSPAKNIYNVTSPFVGTFYLSPSPGDPPYVKLGDKIRKGQILCIVEAMKIMNEIDAESSGELVEICVENESLVEYGQILFKIKMN
jgi:acetyl-CoA carboxylase biotin carboxyl carrier protein